VPAFDEQPRRFRFDASDPTRSVVELDGTDIARHVAAVQISADARTKVPQVLLELSVKTVQETVFDGMAVVRRSDGDPAAAIRAYLADVDPEKLADAALNRDDLGDEPHAVTAATLRQLAEWAGDVG
jgi:hypothetical protein